MIVELFDLLPNSSKFDVRFIARAEWRFLLMEPDFNFDRVIERYVLIQLSGIRKVGI